MDELFTLKIKKKKEKNLTFSVATVENRLRQ